MIPKPKSSPMSQHAFEQLPFMTRLDIWTSSWVPGWIIGVVVSAAFALAFAFGIASVLAIANWDLSWYWSVTSRAVFGGLTLLFSIIVWSST